jgi:PD-(D/E)XK nuclease superfamily
MSTEAVRRDLGPMLAHGEPETGIGQGEVAEQAAQPTAAAGRRATRRCAGQQREWQRQPQRRGRDRRLRRPRARGRVMSATATTVAGLGEPAAVAPSAAELAARIQVPRRLPPRYDGQPLAHLSHSSYSRFALCPEDWRRRHMLGERSAPSGSMFLGRRVDDPITLYYRRILEHGDRLELDQVKDAYRDGWRADEEAERERLGIAWEDDLRLEAAFKIGLDAITLTFERLIPHLGEPVAVQRRLEYTLAPGLEWSVLCYLDLETLRPDGDARVPAIVDYKVKTTPLSRFKADHDFQPAVYLAGRWLEGDRAAEFSFAQIAKPGPRRKAMSASIVTTTRSIGQRRGALARIAQVARHLVAYYERFGPDEPWGFADPSGWKCSARYCEAWGSCPGGAGV